MRTEQLKALRERHPKGPAVPAEVVEFAKGWLQGWLDGRSGETDIWHGVGDFDLNLTFDEDDSVVSVVAYVYDEDRQQTEGSYYTCVATSKIKKSKKRS